MEIRAGLRCPACRERIRSRRAFPRVQAVLAVNSLKVCSGLVSCAMRAWAWNAISFLRSELCCNAERHTSVLGAERAMIDDFQVLENSLRTYVVYVVEEKLGALRNWDVSWYSGDIHGYLGVDLPLDLPLTSVSVVLFGRASLLRAMDTYSANGSKLCSARSNNVLPPICQDRQTCRCLPSVNPTSPH